MHDGKQCKSHCLYKSFLTFVVEQFSYEGYNFYIGEEEIMIVSEDNVIDAGIRRSGVQVEEWKP